MASNSECSYEFSCTFPSRMVLSTFHVRRVVARSNGVPKKVLAQIPFSLNKTEALKYPKSDFAALIPGSGELWYLCVVLFPNNPVLELCLRRCARKEEDLAVRLDNVKVRSPDGGKVMYISPFTLLKRNTHFGCEWCADGNSFEILDFSGCEFILEGSLHVSSMTPIKHEKPVNNPFDFVKNMEKMYKDGAFWDVTFRLGDEELRAHKFVLVAQSPVFACMFEHDMKEKNTNEIPIEDFDPHEFDCFLLTLYTSEMEDKNWDTVFALHRAGAKYQVPWLQKMCSEMLSSGLTNDNVCSVLVQSDLFNDDELKQNVNSFLLCCFSEVGKSEEWLNIIKNHPILATEVLCSITASVTSMKVL